MGLRQRLMHQFGNPRGALGRAAGFIMSHRTSNLEHNAWAVSLLNVRPADCVLEIGYGPGVAIHMLGQLAADGLVYGIDRSPLMFEQASRRNSQLIRTGRVKLMVASVSNLPPLERKVDKVLDINTYQFWEDRAATLVKVRELLRPGGIIAIAHQPRNQGATEADAVNAGQRISARLRASDYQEVRVKLKRMKSAPVVCVIGKNPA